jgi:phage shock protein E
MGKRGNSQMLRFGFRQEPSGAKARELVQSGAILLDVRSPQEFSGEHVTGALNIPVHELPRRIAELGPPSQTVVVYCHSGARSASAAGFLRQAGFHTVHDMGAMFNWHG